MPKSPATTAARRRHNPLENDLLATGPLKSKAPKDRSRRDDDDEGSQYVNSKSSRKILQMGRELHEGESEEQSGLEQAVPAGIDFGRAGLEPDFEEDSFDDNTEDVWGDEEEATEEIEIEADDLATFNKFLPADSADEDALIRGLRGAEEDDDGLTGQGGGTNLADLILAKISAFEMRNGSGKEPQAIDDEPFELPPKVVEVYSKIGLILSRYRSGKLPKPFKILPTIPGWEQILEVLNYNDWTPNAVYEATRIFVSSKAAVAQRFFEIVLLDRVRSDIYETKKLNVHLFKSLKRGLYKPSAWFKGILFPLIGSGTCTIKEATIISAVLQRVSVPVLHSAAALKGLCEIASEDVSQGSESSSATNIFLKTLLDKKYALPYQVVDAVVFYLLSFRGVDTSTKLTVTWWQVFLSFAERYKNDIAEDQREALLDLLLTHGHPAIGPEVRKELLAGRGRGQPMPSEGPAFDGDDTMLIDS